MQDRHFLSEITQTARKLSGDWRARIGLAFVMLLILTSLVVHRFSAKDERINCTFQIARQENVPVVQGDAFKVDTCVELEVASTNSARTLGLSGRKSMDWDNGLLFDFHKPDEYCMWMKDMHFALDMMWLNEDKEIIYMIEDVTPDTYPKSFCGPAEARYVVEVNTGVVKAGDLQIHQRLRF
jgi:uncharacterized membrane protein (UPF0127 family)